jgi:hypothetical protein
MEDGGSLGKIRQQRETETIYKEEKQMQTIPCQFGKS